MKKLKKYRGLIVSFLLAALTVLLVHSYIVALENQYDSAGLPEDEGDTVEVVVAGENLARGTVLTETELELKPVYKSQAHPKAVKDKEEVLGEVIVQELVKDEVLLEPRILSKEAAERLSHLIPEGKRAITVSVNEVSGVAGFIQAGDKIDVIATDFEDDEETSRSERILTEQSVLAAGERVLYSNQELVQEVSAITIAVTPQDAEILTHADESGVIRLLLNPIKIED